MSAVMVVTLAAVVLAAQQPTPVRDGIISGRVIDAVTGKPIGAAAVTTGGDATPAPRPGEVPPPNPTPVLTGGDGRFVIRHLSSGSVTVRASKGGYAEGASGRRRPGGTTQPVVIDPVQRSAEITIRMWKHGAITGRVIDEAGEPIVGLQVRAAVRTSTSRGQQFLPSAGAFTDDLGVYRLSNLAAGDYIVMASPPAMSVTTNIFRDVARTGRAAGALAAAIPLGPNMAGLEVGPAWFPLGRGMAIPPPFAGRLQVYPPTFHPSASSPAHAAILPVGIGEERAAVDIQLLPAATSRVSGTVLSSSGAVEMVTVKLIPAGIREMPTDGLAATSVTDSAGNFAFAAVVPGQYVLAGNTARGSSNELHWLALPIVVAGEDVEGLVAMVAPPLKIAGRLHFEGNSPRPPTTPGRPALPIPFLLEPLDAGVPGSIGIATTGSDYGFTVTGYLPGRYRMRVPDSPRGWMFKAALLNGVDVSEAPIDLSKDVADLVLVFTDRWTGISGSVQGPGADAATVLAFTTDGSTWPDAGRNARRLKSARTNAFGQFGISALPPGDYYVVAITEESVADWREPAILESLARIATHVSIGEGESKTMSLPLREVRR